MNYAEKLKENLKDKNKIFVGSVLLGTYALFHASSLILLNIFGRHPKLVIISFLGSLLIGFAVIAKWGKTDTKFWKYSLLMIVFGILIFLAKTGMR